MLSIYNVLNVLVLFIDIKRGFSNSDPYCNKSIKACQIKKMFMLNLVAISLKNIIFFSDKNAKQTQNS